MKDSHPRALAVPAPEGDMNAPGSAVPGVAAPPLGDLRPRRRPARAGGIGDRLFRGGSRGSGVLVLAVMAAVGLFLLLRGLQALQAEGPLKFLTTQAWNTGTRDFGIAGVLTGSIFIALVAIVVSVPLALGTGLFISEIARGWLQRTLISLVDLMAAVPSVVYGLWGKYFLQGQVVGVARWISTWLGWIPVFRVDGADPGNPLASDSVYTASSFVAGLTVALMVAPIACSIMREVFAQAPLGEREGAYALGATRWGMIRTVVLPFARGGVIGGTMLGLGRALGETIAVVMIISPVFIIQPHILQSTTNSVAALIALQYGESDQLGLSALMAAGLALFLLTLIVNYTASLIVSRSRSGAQSEA